jgi:VWFA-related protein
MRMVAMAALVFASALLSDAQPAQAPSARFPSEIELVTVDTVVLDKSGQPVTGLTAADFNITENGVPQTLASFEAVVVPAAPSVEVTPSPRRFSTNVGAETRQGRTFLIVFDDIHLSPGQAHRAKAAAAEFLRSGVAPGDFVTLIATGGGAWWNARMPEGRDRLLAILQRLDGRYVPDSSPDKITEFEALRIHLYDDLEAEAKVKRRFDSYGAAGQQKTAQNPQPRDGPMSGAYGMIDPEVRARAAEVYRLSLSRRKITFGVLARALGSLGGSRGRKAAVLLSQGFVYELDLPEMKQAVEASRRGNVPVYFVDTRGLAGLPEGMTAAFGRPLEVQDTVAVLADITRDAEGSEALALDTGGFVAKNTNDLSRAIVRVSAESRAYYLLGYVPSDLRRDGRFRKIEVKLSGGGRGGLKVRARRGYYAPSESGVAAKTASTDQPEIVQALESPFEVADVPLRVGAYVFDEVLLDKANVSLAAEVDVSGFAFRDADGRLHDTMAFLVEAQHQETGEYYRYDQKVEMALLPATHEQLRRTWYPVSREFSLPPGGYQAKVVVRDMTGGKVGSVIHDFEVPPTGVFRMSTLIVTDTVQQVEGAAAPKPLLQVRRTFAPGSMLYCQFSVYGAAKDPRGRMPRVSAGYEIRRADGSLFKRADPTPIRPTSLGALLRLHGISLAGAAAGAYELRLSVQDEVAGKSLDVKEPFVIDVGG